MKSSFRSFCLIAALAVVAPIASFATPILGGSVVVNTDGDVIATFLDGAGASYTNNLFLDVSGVGFVFNNHTSHIGDSVNLGFFSAGTELIFRLHVNTGSSIYDLYTGPDYRNPDSIAHAIVDDAYSATATSVAFEDVLGGGDRNFRDMVFSFTNVHGTDTPPVPEAGSSALLLGLGLASLWLGRRRSAA